ncbi:Tyrosine-protein phosphatase Lar [Araneus ventricosus]|uniref:protein-tyrosine-phosphatase n=1 Tax=Araneus ventricosus TaxID=182803 RepID=A0A4Y2VRK3_ARAVE|nr:Tyrosine-protein phosphatase Lar [Araneus ventricosus]
MAEDDFSAFPIIKSNKNLFRDIAHLWFTGWPDVGVPKDPSSLITFVQQCRPFINCNSGPSVVHCSTGTGRTGVFLALDICMREYDESRSIDILQVISQLRRDRGGAVQNKDQYILIHESWPYQRHMMRAIMPAITLSPRLPKESRSLEDRYTEEARKNWYGVHLAKITADVQPSS